MSHRRVIVLGTASQVPTRHRNHNGYFLQWDDEGLLFDPGEGTQRQMTMAGVRASQITRIFITHFHGDHCLGLAGLVQRLSLDEVPHEIKLYFPASGQKYVDRLRKASIFRDRARIRECPIHKAGVIYEDKKIVLEAQSLNHSVPTYGYRLIERDKVRMLPEKLAALGVQGPDIGRLQRAGSLEHEGRTITLDDVSHPLIGQRFAFIMDTSLCPEAYMLADGADLLVCESTYLKSEEQDARNNGHLTAAQAADIAQKGGAQKLVLTHFSQRYLDNHGFVAEAREIFPNSIAVKDGDVVDVPPRRPYEPQADAKGLLDLGEL